MVRQKKLKMSPIMGNFLVLDRLKWFDPFNLIKNNRFHLYCLFNANCRYTKMRV